MPSSSMSASAGVDRCHVPGFFVTRNGPSVDGVAVAVANLGPVDVPRVHDPADVVREDLEIAVPVEVPHDRARPAQILRRLRPAGEHRAVLVEYVYLLRVPRGADDLEPAHPVEVRERARRREVAPERVEDAPRERLAVAVPHLDAVAVPRVDVVGSDDDLGMPVAV